MIFIILFTIVMMAIINILESKCQKELQEWRDSVDKELERTRRYGR